jgi:hypothetical protein
MSFKDKLKLLFSNIWSFISPFVKIFAQAAGPLLAASALTAVKTVSQYAIDNDEDKRRQAFKLIEQDLKTQGIAIGVTITTSMINAAIEAAVQKLKAGE